MTNKALHSPIIESVAESIVESIVEVVMKSIFFSFGVLLAASYTNIALSQVMVDSASPTNAATKYEGGVSFSSVEYRASGSNDIDVDRKILFGGLSTAIATDIDLMAQFGVILDAEYEDIKDDGFGWMAGIGPKFMIIQNSDYKVLGNAFLNLTKEAYKVSGDDFEVSLWDLHAGAMVEFALDNNTVKPYAGIDLVVNSDGDVKYGDSKTDFERDDMLNVKFGAILNLESVVIRPEATIFGEQTFTLAFSNR